MKVISAIYKRTAPCSQQSILHAEDHFTHCPQNLLVSWLALHLIMLVFTANTEKEFSAFKHRIPKGRAPEKESKFKVYLFWEGRNYPFKQWWSTLMLLGMCSIDL